MICKHFGSCGGCTIQDIPYAQQLETKETFVKALFPGVYCHPIIACDPPWHYRNKMEFTFAESKEGKRIGLYKKKHVFAMEECLLTPPWFQEALNTVQNWWDTTDLHAYYPPRDRGDLRTLTVRYGFRTQKRMVILTTAHPCDVSKDLFTDTSFYLRIQHSTRGTPTYFEEIHLSGDTNLHEELHVNGHTFSFSIAPSAFFQPNPRQAEKLYTRALEMAPLTSSSLVFDLYCGTGALGMFAAKTAKQVIGIELNEDSVHSARHNARLNCLDNISFLAGDVGALLPTLPEHPSLVMVDPPRAGLGPQAIAHLKALNPKTILYISCNPETQAADIQALEYKIQEIQPVDQFPHTHHLENIVLLNKF